MTNPACAPGQTVTIPCAFTQAGSTLTLTSQGADGSLTTNVPATFDGTNCTFTVPDGAQPVSPYTIANGGNTVTGTLRVGSAYVLAADFIGTGDDVSGLAAGELDVILRRASHYADVFMGGTARLLQTMEQSVWNANSRRIYPRHRNIRSLDKLVYRISPTQIGTILPSDCVINDNLRYIEVLAYAILNYSLLGAIQNLGYDAQIVETTYTHGWAYNETPAQMQEAVALITSELLIQRDIQAKGLGGFSSVKEGNVQYQRRTEGFAIPDDAKALLKPYIMRKVA